MSRFIPLSIPNFEGNEKKYVVDAVEKGWVSTGGAYITKLEDMLAEYVDVKKVVACQSGTSALHLALMECNVTRNDAVIVPTLTFIAAVNPVKYIGAEPIFMDCDDSLCMDPMKLNKFCENECKMTTDGLMYISSGKIIKALVVVHVFGNMADMEAIMDIAKRYNIKVVEDATEALGSKFLSGRYVGKYAGTIGDFGAYSFNGNKIITTGGGGAVTGQDIKKVEHIHYISTQAKDDDVFYVHNEIGYNYRMTNLQAAVGVAQLEMLDEFIVRKQKNYSLYRELLANSDKYELLSYRDGVFSNMWFYALRLKDENCTYDKVKKIVEKLSDKGVQTRPIWGLIHEQLPYRHAVAYEIEKACYEVARIINIPCSTNLTDVDIHTVVGVLKEVIGI